MNVCCGVNVRPWHQRREHLELTCTRQIVQGNPVPGTRECHSWPTFGFQPEQPIISSMSKGNIMGAGAG